MPGRENLKSLQGGKRRKIIKINHANLSFIFRRKGYRSAQQWGIQTWHTDCGTMDQKLTVLVERLKKGVVERCRERVISAAEKKKNGIPDPEPHLQTPGIASILKKARGL